MNYLLDFRERDTGGAVVPGVLTRLSDGASGDVAERSLQVEPNITFLLHGFNVSRAEGRTGLDRLSLRLSAAQGGGIVAVLWPGDHWTGFVSYPFEGRDADDTADELARFIVLVVHSGTPLSFVTHSLGARVAMEAMISLLEEDYSVTQVCLMAAAIDDYSVSSSEDYRVVVEEAGRVAVLSSKEDEVLKYVYPAADLLQSFIFFWRESFGLALGYHGPRPDEDGGPVPSNVLHEAIPEARNSDHGDYIPDPMASPKSQANQKSAAKFADEVIGGNANPTYR